MIFLFDEHFSPVLVYILKVLDVKAVHINEVFPRGTPDVKYLQRLKGTDYVLVTCDEHIRTRPAEAAAYKESGVTAVFIRGFFEGMNRWGQAEWLITRWPRIATHAVRVNPGTPIQINRNGTARYILTADQKRFGQKTL